ncbi:MAG TPA: polysaccharide deacetylase family protein, partial [Armatimonadota bacterium]|nr:polysaccharide deacetylase family protein [Armatimonadota bacterium]
MRLFWKGSSGRQARCFSVVGLLAGLLIALPLSADAADYLSQIEQGAGMLAEGRLPEAVQAFQRAREMDMNDSLAAAGLGCALDAKGETSAARVSLALALQLDSKSTHALWANAIAALNEGDLENACRRLEMLASREKTPGPELWVALAYARCAAGNVSGATEALKHVGNLDALPRAHRATANLVTGALAYSAGEYACAADSLRAAARDLPPVNFLELTPKRRVPLLAQMRSSAPVEPLPLVSVPSTGVQARMVQGTIRLYLDPFRFPEAQYAMFLVDGHGLHSTNTRPMRYDWDTRQYRNGYHKVVIRAEDGTGQYLGQTEEILLVHNEGADFPLLYPQEKYAHAEQSVCQAVGLQPDVLATNYLLGLSLLHLNDKEGAAAALELVMGFDPDYGQARKELQGLYTAGKDKRPRNISSVPTSARQVAITFDDGPNPRYTPPLLDILERYKARCTMFLVGTQAESYPDIVREIVEKGHEVADHTYSHPNLKTVDQRTVE